MNWAVEATEARAGESDVVRIEMGYETTAASMREYLAGACPVELTATREGRWEVVVNTDAGVGRTLDTSSHGSGVHRAGSRRARDDPLPRPRVRRGLHPREMSAQRTTSGPVLPRRERRLTGS
jgi:hypothetical protein